MGMFRRLWFGQYSLAPAFWGFYLVGMFVAAIVAGAISGVFIVFGFRQLGLLVAAVFYIAYLFVATIGFWRSAGKYPYTLWWPIMAKFVVVLMTVPFVIVAITMYYPKFQIEW